MAIPNNLKYVVLDRETGEVAEDVMNAYNNFVIANTEDDELADINFGRELLSLMSE